ncbi:polysaccharide deacetylase family protein [Kitasatospora sp. NPDC051853]|uniref:polysaccharide deacetylase family protein n=1 Tax=Kitasatospora sp. NPDC051853 TaxID=3364058 RepID=UPI00379788FD
MGAGRAALLAATSAEAVHLAPAAVRLAPVRGLLLRRLAGHGAAGHVALTFDDGPDPASTPLFLDRLDELGATATFFLLGSMLEQWPSLGRELTARGHEVAVHGWYHDPQWWPSPARDARELRRTVEAVTELCGRRPLWYRPPYGVLTTGLLLAARQVELRPVLWTAWGRDWTAAATPASVYRTLRPGLHGGATVLLHDSDCTSAPGSWRSALDALPLVAERCSRLGLELGPLREHGLIKRHYPYD